MPRTVMVIDDNPEERERTCAALASLKLVVVAACGEGLMSSRIAEQHRPDCIFIAIERPLPRSLQMVNHLRDSVPDSVLIGYSTLTDVDVFQQAIRAGASFLLETPIRPADVVRAVGRADDSPAPASASGAGRIVAVVGQKGGIGKTTVSTNLAAALANEANASVLIIDFDTTFGDVGLSLDVDHTGVTTAELAEELPHYDRDEFKKTLIPHVSGAYVLPAPAHVGEWVTVSPAKLLNLVDFAATLFDYVLVDTPGAFNDAVGAALEIADHAMIVTSLELSSVKNTSLLLEVLREEGYEEERTLVIVNHTLSDPGVSVVDVAPRLQRQSVWEVPHDRLVRMGSQAGHPVVLLDAGSPGSKSLRALARRLATEPDNIDRRSAIRPPSTPADLFVNRRLRGVAKRAAS